MTPQEIVHELDKHIIGQDAAKRAVAIALRNRWRRQQVTEPLRQEITPKNILMIGPTGVGKTEIARRLAKLADAPFIKVEATKFTEVGYVGKDVDSIIRDLVETAIKQTREQETGKVRHRAEDQAEERILDVLLPPAREIGFQAEQEDRDSATRQKFRKKLREGELDDKEIEIEVAAMHTQMEILAPPGMEDLTSQIQSMFQNLGGTRRKTRKLKIREAMQLLIEEEAAKQRTQWEEVIQIFNARFFVPFKLTAKNRTAVMLGHAPMIELGFTYHDGADSVSIEKDALVKALSMGERKALYVLNVIFEIEARKKANQETIMVIDDLADSFDYQNKYAIIQYLKDISEDRLFKQIIMTHNFDFFRTINSRFVSYPHCLMVSKTGAGLALEKASGIKNIFVNDWKPHFFTDPKKKIASIPFLRNLVEYTTGEADPKFAKLTSLLHWRADSAAITEAELNAIYNEVCSSTGTSSNGVRPVIDIIHAEARLCMTAGVGINFEKKIVLAIAIRIGAEQFMVKKINDAAFVAAIQSHQTQTLLTKFREMFGSDIKALEILDRVILMTPENIHLNSFMYEPIVDMSDEHLRKLYADVVDLK